MSVIGGFAVIVLVSFALGGAYGALAWTVTAVERWYRRRQVRRFIYGESAHRPTADGIRRSELDAVIGHRRTR